jgi:hypothetical protein
MLFGLFHSPINPDSLEHYSGCQKYVPFRAGYKALAGDISF